MTEAKIPGSGERPAAGRRAVLTGGVAGLAMAAGTTLVRGQPAAAQSNPSVTDWLNVVSDYGADNTGKTETAEQVNTALTAAGNSVSSATPVNAVVYLPPGIYKIAEPLVIPTGVCLRGAVPVNHGAQLADPDIYGSVIEPVASSTWAKHTQPGAIYASSTVKNSTVYRPVIQDLWIDARSAPKGLHGISFYGTVWHGLIKNVGMWGTPGNGINCDGSSGSNRPDGVMVDTALIEAPVGHGVYLDCQDGIFNSVHVQNGNTNGTGDGFYLVQPEDGRLIGCRADSCTNGYTFPTGNGCILIGCSTEANLENGLNVQNSGTAIGAPVRCVGCSFTFDGQSGTQYAGMSVTGLNVVLLEQCSVLVGADHTYPNYALSVATQNGQSPILVQAMGGLWNCNGSAAVNVASGVTGLVSYSAHAIAGGMITAKSVPAMLQRNPL